VKAAGGCGSCGGKQLVAGGWRLAAASGGWAVTASGCKWWLPSLTF